MNKRKSNTTLKFLIFILVFIIFVFIFVLLFVIPGIKEYKNAKSSYNSGENIQAQLQQEQEELKSQLEIIKNENRDIIDTFSQEFSPDKFIAFTKKYFDDAKLIKVNNETNSSALHMYKFSAKVKAKNPKQFYEFVKELHNFNGIIKINFPINISSQNDFLTINFHLSAYSMSTK